jgi:hypothetical protein
MASGVQLVNVTHAVLPGINTDRVTTTAPPVVVQGRASRQCRDCPENGTYPVYSGEW